MKQNRKWKIPHTILERQTLRFSSFKNRKLKVKLWWVGAHERKYTAFFVPFMLSEGNFFKMFCLNVQRIEYIFRIQMLLHIKKYFFIHFCCLFLKSSKVFSASLRILFPLKRLLEGNVCDCFFCNRSSLLKRWLVWFFP